MLKPLMPLMLAPAPVPGHRRTRGQRPAARRASPDVLAPGSLPWSFAQQLLDPFFHVLRIPQAAGIGPHDPPALIDQRERGPAIGEGVRIWFLNHPTIRDLP